MDERKGDWEKGDCVLHGTGNRASREQEINYKLKSRFDSILLSVVPVRSPIGPSSQAKAKAQLKSGTSQPCTDLAASCLTTFMNLP